MQNLKGSSGMAAVPVLQDLQTQELFRIQAKIFVNHEELRTFSSMPVREPLEKISGRKMTW